MPISRAPTTSLGIHQPSKGHFMSTKNRFRLLLAAMALLGSPFLLTPSADATTPSHYNPTCVVVASVSVDSWMINVTANFTSNPCNYPVRAYVLCHDMWVTGSTMRVGNTITATGTSVARCDITQNAVGWGWQKYSNGVWITF